jgi:hypothetical protein
VAVAARELISAGRDRRHMEWHSWLSRAGLAPSLTYEYGLLFAQNELEPGDAAHFDHDLLKSMGIAKHRLEILRRVKKQEGDI